MTERIMLQVGNRVIIKGQNSFDVARIVLNKKTGEEVISGSGRSFHGKLDDALEWMVRDMAGEEANTVRQYVKAIRKAVREVKATA